MAEDKRLTYSRKWFNKAAGTEDPFDRFFCLWISLIIASQRHRTESGTFVEDDRDSIRVHDYLKDHTEIVGRVMDACSAELQRLANRRGTRYRNAILDTGNAKARHDLENLAEHYLNQQSSMSCSDRVRALSVLISKVRNNLFHGVKVYDDKDDLELLTLVNPILDGVLAECEGFRPSTGTIGVVGS